MRLGRLPSPSVSALAGALSIILAVVGPVAYLVGFVYRPTGQVVPTLIPDSLVVGLILGYAGALTGGLTAGVAVGLFGGLTLPLGAILRVDPGPGLFMGVSAGLLWGLATGLTGSAGTLGDRVANTFARGVVGGLVWSAGLIVAYLVGAPFGTGLWVLAGSIALACGWGVAVGAIAHVSLTRTGRWDWSAWGGLSVGLSVSLATGLQVGFAGTLQMAQASGRMVGSAEVLAALLLAMLFGSGLGFLGAICGAVGGLVGMVLAYPLRSGPGAAARPVTRGLITVGVLLVAAAGLWSAATWLSPGTLASVIHSGSISVVAFSPDGRFLAVGTDGGGVALWDVDAVEPRAGLGVGSGPVAALGFSRDGQTLAVGTGKGVMLWSSPAGEHRGTLEPAGASSLVFSPDGEMLAGAGGGVILWDLPTGKPRATLRDVGEVWAVAFAADGKTLITASTQGTVKLWDLVAWPARRTLEGHRGAVRSLTLGADGRLVAVGLGVNAAVTVWDLTSGSPVASHRVGKGDPYRAILSSDGRLAATVSQDNTVRLWDTTTGQVRATLPRSRTRVTALAFAGDSSVLATGADDGTVSLWDAASGGKRLTLDTTRSAPVQANTPQPSGVVVDRSGAPRSYIYVAWSADGRKEEEGEYRDGKKHGRWTTWHSHGLTARETEYRDGRAHGRSISWDGFGRKSEEGYFRDGKREGLWITWHDNGQKQAEGEYRDGLEHGWWTYWDRDGRQPERGEFRGGRWTSWYDNGRKKAEGEYRDGTRLGRWTYWDPNGQVEREGDWSGGEQAGLWTYYYPSGQKRMAGEFRDGKRDGKWRMWTPAGQEIGVEYRRGERVAR